MRVLAKLMISLGLALSWSSLTQAQSNAKKTSTTASKAAPAQSKTMARNPSGVSDSQKALEVNGQSRNLSMMLTLKSRGDNIDFVKPRQNYQSEIKNTGF